MVQTASRLSALAALLTLCGVGITQDRLPTMPRYDRYEKLSRQIAGSVKYGTLQVRWSDDGKTFRYRRDGKDYVYDVAKRQEAEAAPEPNGAGGQNRPRRNPERGRQFDTAFNIDGALKAFHRDRNLYISDANGGNEIAVTTDGSAAKRTKYGIASWVYGEELGVREAIWWSPDSKRVAYYFFDESQVPDYYLALDQTKVQARLDVEAYPKAGAPNPVVGLFVYNRDSKASVKMDTNFNSGAGPDLGHYVYSVRWSPDGSEILFNRTNRKQNVMEFCAADPSTGRCRVIVRESHPNSWADNSPNIYYLEEDRPGPKRFLWMSERNGFWNLYLYDLSGKLYNAVTQHKFEVSNVARIDVKKGLVWYRARSGENPYLLQLHRVGLDGKGDTRLTDPKFSHNTEVSPNGEFVDIQVRHDTPPTTYLRDERGREIAVLAQSDFTRYNELGLQKAERFTFLAADGKTTLYGTLHKPSDFDPNKKYPLIISVYGGPESGGGLENFGTPPAVTEFGFLVASFEHRGSQGRGKAFKDEMYAKLGITEIDDQAAGVRALAQRPYVDGKRVGIYGTSYGGYASAMCILRHPDVFAAACASSSVTDWRNYDSIYTERYNGLPDENQAGYDAGNAMNYAKNLKGRLMLFFGTADNNVHPSNTYQLVQALARAGKSFEMMVGPDQGHTGINQSRMWEFFIDHLILANKGETLASAWKDRKKRIAARS